MSKDIFENLVTDITAQVLQQVQQQVQTVIATAVQTQINTILTPQAIQSAINAKVDANLQNYVPDVSIVEKNLQSVGEQIAAQLNDRAMNLVNDVVHGKINSIDFNALVLQQISAQIDPANNHYPFMAGSIDGTAIDTEKLYITGDNITGGVIKQFASTGIDDQATGCKLTVMDVGTVFENTLYAPRIEVKGGAIIDGDLDIQGRIVDGPAYQQLVKDVADSTKADIADTVLDQHQDRIFERMLTEGIDIGKISLNGRLIVDEQKLLNVYHSQLRTVGTLQDLQTTGETLLSETLYTSTKRVGINTMSPTVALDIWDDEIEIRIGKQQQGVARIATAKDHVMILGTNAQDNITMTPDGVTAIAQLRIGNMLFSSSATPPHYDAVRGTVVFNENPNLGGPLGWVSLGDARWANFGIID